MVSVLSGNIGPSLYARLIASYTFLQYSNKACKYEAGAVERSLFRSSYLIFRLLMVSLGLFAEWTSMTTMIFITPSNSWCFSAYDVVLESERWVKDDGDHHHGEKCFFCFQPWSVACTWFPLSIAALLVLRFPAWCSSGCTVGWMWEYFQICNERYDMSLYCQRTWTIPFARLRETAVDAQHLLSRQTLQQSDKQRVFLPSPFDTYVIDWGIFRKDRPHLRKGAFELMMLFTSSYRDSGEAHLCRMWYIFS